jgi:hypothetical protein
MKKKMEKKLMIWKIVHQQFKKEKEIPYCSKLTRIPNSCITKAKLSGD